MKKNSFFAFLVMLAVSDFSGAAQSIYEPYTFTTYAGAAPGGFANGAGPLAKFNKPDGIVIDQDGNSYVADSANDVIRKITPAGAVSTFAGMPTISGSTDGRGGQASFNGPTGIAIDQAGNLYVSDTLNDTIRKITPDRVVTTIAGSPGQIGSANGVGSKARFSEPMGLCVDSSGNIFVADTGNVTIRMITPAYEVSLLAGSPRDLGDMDGTGSGATFDYPTDVAIDSAGDLFVTDVDSIRKIAPGAVVTTFAGSTAHIDTGFADGTGDAARFASPAALTIDAAGNLFVCDHTAIRMVTPGAVVTTIVGAPPPEAYPGSRDGTGLEARFGYARGIDVDSTGTLFVSDTDNGTVRKISPSLVVTTLAGEASAGIEDGTLSFSRFSFPQRGTFDAAGNLYIGDGANDTIRKITPAGVVSTLAGSPETFGDRDGTGSAARFANPAGVAADSAGNIFVADANNNAIRKVTSAGVVTTFATGFNYPQDVAVDNSGNVFVADTYNNVIKEITPTGMVSVFAGKVGHSGFVNGTGSAASFRTPSGLAIALDGTLYVGDTGNNAVRKITPAAVVTTLAGIRSQGHTDGPATIARFNYPQGVTVDGAGNVFVADELNSAIRKITPAGEVTTVAGKPPLHGSADGTGKDVRFDMPRGVVVDATGALFVQDSYNNTIRKGVPAP